MYMYVNVHGYLIGVYTAHVRYMYMYMIPVCVYPQSINTVYDRRGYREVVERVAEESMQKAVEEVKAQPDYSSTGEVMYMYMYIHVHVHVHTCTCTYMYL